MDRVNPEPGRRIPKHFKNRLKPTGFRFSPLEAPVGKETMESSREHDLFSAWLERGIKQVQKQWSLHLYSRDMDFFTEYAEKEGSEKFVRRGFRVRNCNYFLGVTVQE